MHVNCAAPDGQVTGRFLVHGTAEGTERLTFVRIQHITAHGTIVATTSDTHPPFAQDSDRRDRIGKFWQQCHVREAAVCCIQEVIESVRIQRSHQLLAAAMKNCP